MSTDEVSWISTFFATSLYTINVSDDGTSGEYDSSLTYSTDAVYTVSMNTEYTGDLPLALMFAVFQIALSDIAAYKTEAYMDKIEANQELQSAASTAIVDAESLQEDVYASTSSFISGNSDWVTTADWSPTNDEHTNYDYAYETLLAQFLEDAGYVGVSGDTITGTYVNNYDDAGNIVSATWTLDSISVLDADGNVYDITVTYTVLRESTLLTNGNTANYAVDTGTFAIASGADADDATTNVLNATITDTGILKACELADITEIDGVAIISGATLTSDQLATLIEELELAQENASTTTQTDMVYAEEYLGQYNSYLTGSSSTLDDYNSALSTIASRIG